MASKTASKRLAKEYMNMQQDPPPFVWAVPDEKNILNWHYLIRGPPDSPYEGGEYHGIIIFPPEYPFKPPSIKMFTPSGRFIPDKPICLNSVSDFHPGTWNPAWGVATILKGLLSFMVTEENTTGSARASDYERRILAKESHRWNISQKRFRDAFPDYSLPEMKDPPNMGVEERGVVANEVAAAATTRESSPTGSLSSTISDSANNNNNVDTQRTTAGGDPKARIVRKKRAPGTAANVKRGDGSWTSTIGRIVSEKWQFGLLVLIAVVVVRLSSA